MQVHFFHKAHSLNGKSHTELPSALISLCFSSQLQPGLDPGWDMREDKRTETTRGKTHHKTCYKCTIKICRQGAAPGAPIKVVITYVYKNKNINYWIVQRTVFLHWAHIMSASFWKWLSKCMLLSGPHKSLEMWNSFMKSEALEEELPAQLSVPRQKCWPLGMPKQLSPWHQPLESLLHSLM